MNNQNSINRTLSRLSRLLHIDMHYIAHGSFWLFIGNIAKSTIGLLIALAFGNLMTKTDFGTYQYILTLASLLLIFSLEDMHYAVTHAVARGYEGTVSQAFRKKISTSLFMVPVALAGALYYYMNNAPAIATSLLIIAISQPLIASTSIYRTLFQGTKDFKHFTLYKMVEDIIPGVCVVAAIFFTRHFLVIVTTYFISHALTQFFLYQHTIKKIQKPAIDPTTIRYGTQLSFIAIIGRLAKHVDKIIVFHYLGAAELAIYSFALAFPSYIHTILEYTIPLGLPKFAAEATFRPQALFRKIFILAALILPVVILYILLAPPIFHLLLPEYTTAIPYSQLYALTPLIGGGLPLALLIAKKAVKEQYTLKITSAIGRTLLMLFLIPSLHLWGVIIALLIDRCVYFVLSLIFVKRVASTEKKHAAHSKEM